MGAGIAMAPGDVAFKSNFATLDLQTSIVLQRRVDRKFEEEGPTLCSALDGARSAVHVWCSRAACQQSGAIGCCLHAG